MIDTDLAKSVTRANTACQLSEAAMIEFNAYCAAYDWPRAEEARRRAVAYLEAYADGIAAVYRKISTLK